MATVKPPDNITTLMEAGLSPWQYNLLREAGQLAGELDMRVYLVGGPVRDLLLSRPSMDCDLVVEGDGLRYAEALAAQLNVTCGAHERFMTAVMHLPTGGEIDVATARREIYEHPGSLPTVAPATLDKDLWRRDFSINAMAVSLAEENFGQLYDPGGGYGDLQAGLVRVLHDKSFLDDPTRVIRAVGFEVRFGFSLEDRTENLIREALNQEALSYISPERRRDVLLPLLKEPTAAAIITRLGELGVGAALGLVERLTAPMTSVLRRLPQASAALEGEEEGPTRALTYLALIAHWAQTDIAHLATKIQLTGDEQQLLGKAVAIIGDPPAALSIRDLKLSELYFALEGLSRIGATALWAAQDDPLVRNHLEQFWHNLRDVAADIDGDDLIAAGAEPGPQFGAALREAVRVKLDEAPATVEQQLAAALTHLAKADRSF